MKPQKKWRGRLRSAWCAGGYLRIFTLHGPSLGKFAGASVAYMNEHPSRLSWSVGAAEIPMRFPHLHGVLLLSSSHAWSVHRVPSQRLTSPSLTGPTAPPQSPHRSLPYPTAPSRQPPRCLPGASQVPPRCLPGASQVPPRSLTAPAWGRREGAWGRTAPSQRPHSALTAPSQRPPMPITCPHSASQRPHRDRTAPSQRPHRDRTGVRPPSSPESPTSPPSVSIPWGP